MFDNNLITTAFEIVARGDDMEASISINGHDVYYGYGESDDLLKLLAMSPVRDHLEELRDKLNEVLGAPKQTLSELGEVRAAQSVLKKHFLSGFIENIEWSSTERELYVTL